jgi:rubrerythrin
MDLGEAIKTAIALEDKIVDVYGKYADKFSSPVGNKIFKLLGEEEEGHVAYLKSKLVEWEKSGKVTVDDLKTIVPDKEAIKANVKKHKAAAKQADINDEIEVFKKALDMEMEASAFYRDLVGKLAPEDQKLFQRFLEIEEGHEAIVKAEIDNARGLGFWFDFQEFDLESA